MNDIDPTSWIGELAASMVKPSDMTAVVQRLNSEIAVELPIFDSDQELRRDLDASTAGQIRAFIATMLAQDGESRPASEAVDLARTIAHRGMELTVLLRIYRHGQQAALRYASEVLEAQDVPDQNRAETLTEVWSRASDWFSLCVEQLIAVYTEEHERWLRSALTRRKLQVEAILRGDSIDIAAAEADLSHPLLQRQTAVVIRAGDEAEGTTRPEAFVTQLAKVLKAPRPLIVPAGSHTVWAWLATNHDPDLKLLDTIAFPFAEMRIGIGITAAGIDGFRSSHREAVAALEAGNDRITLYSDVEVVSLLSSDRTALRTFVSRELGQLAANSNETVRESLLAYLAYGAAGASTQLGVHRNTIRYRLQQAELILGHTVESRRLELHLALLCADAATEG